MSVKFAGKLLPLLKDAWKVLKPDFSTAGSTFNTAFRYGPDVLYPFVAAGALPEGASAGDRAGVFAEDLGVNLLTSAVGQYGGRQLGNKLAAKYNNPQLVEGLQTAGDITAGLAQMGPRPLFNKALQKAGLEQQELLEAQIRADERQQLESAIAAMIASGGLVAGLGGKASPGLVRRTVM